MSEKRDVSEWMKLSQHVIDPQPVAPGDRAKHISIGHLSPHRLPGSHVLHQSTLILGTRQDSRMVGLGLLTEHMKPSNTLMSNDNGKKGKERGDEQVQSAAGESVLLNEGSDSKTMHRIDDLSTGGNTGEAQLESCEYLNDQLVNDTRAETTSLFTTAANPARRVELLRESIAPQYADGVVEQLIITEVGKLLEMNTLKAEIEAMEILKRSGLLAPQRWQGIYQNTEAQHNFATKAPERHNELAEQIVKLGNLNDDSWVIELGPGYCNDAIYVASQTGAEIIGIDSSEYAVEQAKANIKQADEDNTRGKIESKIDVVAADFLEQLKAMVGVQFDAIVSHSTLHYSPPNMLRKDVFPLIASRLKDDGRFFMVMKLSASASAQSENQRKLVGDKSNPVHTYNPSIDTIDRIFRVYPENQEDVLRLTEPSMETISSRVVRLSGYEKEGQDEWAIEYIGRKKR